MSAAGKVCTGFSLPWVAKYSCTGGTISFSDAMRLARGVDVSIEPDESGDNDFYADNVKAESDAGTFTGGKLNITVDGLFQEAESFIMGLPSASNGWIDYNDDQEVPYVAFSYVARYQSDNVESFTPVVIVKTQFDQVKNSAATSTETKNFQTQSLTANIMRGDDEKHTWKKLADEDYSTEALAEAAIKALFGVTGDTTGDTTGNS